MARRRSKRNTNQSNNDLFYPTRKHNRQSAQQTREERSVKPVHQDKKSWTRQDMVSVKWLTDNQKAAAEDYFAGNHLALLGSAGSGKTFEAVYLACCTLLNKDADKIAIFRSTVQTRDMGYLKGDEEEKYAPFEAPYHGIFAHIFGRNSTYADMKKQGLVEFHPTAFLRGTTFDDTILIIDEAQSMTFHEIDTILSRVGENSTVILIGDTKQDDLKNKREISGLAEFVRLTQKSALFKTTTFTFEDCVRSGFVKDWLRIKETN